MENCTQFLKWALPKLQFKWDGFRKVRNQVCKRIKRRLKDLEIPSFDAYQRYLEDNPQEWRVLDEMCRITISRFYRDREIFDRIKDTVFPSLAQVAARDYEQELRVWIIGSCSGEEVYTLKILWELGLELAEEFFPKLKIIATETDGHLINRAKIAKYQAGTLKELPDEFVEQAFNRENELFVLKELFKEDVEFLQQDIRQQTPPGEFRLIFCRNLVFTYFDESLQKEILKKLLAKLKNDGFLIIGKKESLPDADADFRAWADSDSIFQNSTLAD